MRNHNLRLQQIPHVDKGADNSPIKLSPHSIEMSHYKIRHSKVLSVQNSMQRLRESFLGSTITQRSQVCQICKIDFGLTYQFCRCKFVYYHDKCFQDRVRRQAQEIYEGAFFCSKGCQIPYRIQSRVIRDFTQRGKLIIAVMAVTVSILIAIIVTFCVYWKLVTPPTLIPGVCGLIIGCGVLACLARRLRPLLFKVEWKIRPFLETDVHLQFTSLAELLPYIKKGRDIQVYNEENDQIIEA